MTAPTANPAPHFQPRHMNAAIVPTSAITAISFTSRETVCPNQSSGIAIGRVFRYLADELHDSGSDSQQEKRNVKKVRAKRLVEKISDDVAHQRSRRQQKRQPAIGARLFHPRPFAPSHTASLAATAPFGHGSVNNA